MTTLSRFFPHRVCINLDRRPGRWERLQRRLERHGLGAVRRFSAVDGRRTPVPVGWDLGAGAYGCLRSHLEVVGRARSERWESVLLLEDDVEFREEFLQTLADIWPELPDDWDMLYFGALHLEEPLAERPHWVRLKRSLSTYMYALRSTVYDAFIEVNSTAQGALDQNNLALQERFNCYCCMPHLAWVESGGSDVSPMAPDHWYLRESLVLGGPGMDRTLDRTVVLLDPGSDSAVDRHLFRHYQGQCDVLRRSLGRVSLEAECLSGSGKDYVVFCRRSIQCQPIQLRAMLRMCDIHPAASSPRQVILLDEDHTKHLLQGGSVELSDCPNRPRRGRFDGFFICTRDALEVDGLRGEAWGDWDAAVQLAKRQPSTFDTPGYTLHLG